tara:strand:- start:37308 stop:38399 length:1092 start_codon:yes stop_codon:yes gene_type:complete
MKFYIDGETIRIKDAIVVCEGSAIAIVGELERIELQAGGEVGPGRPTDVSRASCEAVHRHKLDADTTPEHQVEDGKLATNTAAEALEELARIAREAAWETLRDAEPHEHTREPCKTVPVVIQEEIDAQVGEVSPEAVTPPPAPPTPSEVEDPPTDTPESSSATPASWGGLHPKGDPVEETAENPTESAHPEKPTLWLFTLTLANGTKVLNQGTVKGSTVEEAEAAVRSSWGLLTTGKPEKAIAEIEYQEGGRVGQDRPDVPADQNPEEYDAAKGKGSHIPEKIEGAATLFRWHRGTLSESMATKTECGTRAQLLSILQSEPQLAKVADGQVELKWHTYDDRIKWDTWLVTIDGHAVGMTNGEL